MKLLLSKGADIDQATTTAITPLFVAAVHGHHAVEELLLSMGANISICSEGVSPADIAKQEGHQEVAKLLKFTAAIVPSSIAVSSIGPLTSHVFALFADGVVAEESVVPSGTEELRRVEELSRQVQGLGADRKVPRSTCDACGVAVEKLKKCPCLVAFYCSAECQKQTWPSHKAVCTFKKQ